MKYLLILISILSFQSCNSQNNLKDDFIMTWDTRNEGYGDSTQIIVPLRGSYSIEWQEIGYEENNGVVKNCNDNTVIAFPKPGKYQLVVTGDLVTMNFETYTIDTIPKYGKKDYKFLSVDQWGTTIWKSFDSYFYNCCSLEIHAIDTPNLSQVSSFRQAFCHARNFNSSLDNWNMSSVKDMSYMFYDAWKFNQPLNSWNVSNLETTHSMFGYAKVFNQPLSNWNVNKVYKMSGMFNHAYDFNQNIENWDVSNVLTMSTMFNGARSFNQPLQKWHVANVKEMVLMFMNTDSFDQPLEKWDVSGISETGFSGMFYMADKFNHPLNEWRVSNVSDINSMFVKAKSFNQPLDKWQIPENCKLNITLTSGEPRGVFSGSSMSEENLIITLESWNRMDILEIFK